MFIFKKLEIISTLIKLLLCHEYIEKQNQIIDRLIHFLVIYFCSVYKIIKVNNSILIVASLVKICFIQIYEIQFFYLFSFFLKLFRFLNYNSISIASFSLIFFL